MSVVINNLPQGGGKKSLVLPDNPTISFISYNNSSEITFYINETNQEAKIDGYNIYYLKSDTKPTSLADFGKVSKQITANASKYAYMIPSQFNGNKVWAAVESVSSEGYENASIRNIAQCTVGEPLFVVPYTSSVGIEGIKYSHDGKNWVIRGLPGYNVFMFDRHYNFVSYRYSSGTAYIHIYDNEFHLITNLSFSITNCKTVLALFNYYEYTYIIYCATSGTIYCKRFSAGSTTLVTVSGMSLSSIGSTWITNYGYIFVNMPDGNAYRTASPGSSIPATMSKIVMPSNAIIVGMTRKGYIAVNRANGLIYYSVNLPELSSDWIITGSFITITKFDTSTFFKYGNYFVNVGGNYIQYTSLNDGINWTAITLDKDIGTIMAVRRNIVVGSSCTLLLDDDITKGGTIISENNGLYNSFGGYMKCMTPSYNSNKTFEYLD